MLRGLAIGWLLGMTTFGVGIVAGANWYDVRTLPTGATSDTIRQFAADGCEPLQSPSVLIFRCPRLRIR